MAQTRELRRRIFFALWPDEDTRRAMVRATRAAVRRSGGKATPAANLHVTLAFLGPVTEAHLNAVRHIGVPTAGRFEMTFDTLGFWERSRVLWAAPGTVPPRVTALERTLWDRLVALGFERESRAYRPHVTLARKAHAVDAQLGSVPWPVAELALVESKPGARSPVYEVLETWPLEA